MGHLGAGERRIVAAILGVLLIAGCGDSDSDSVAGRIGALSNGRPEGRRQAAEELGRVTDASEAHRVVEALTESLIGDGDAEVRAAAARSLGEVIRFSPEVGGAAEARASLAGALEDPEPEVRHASSVALARIGATPERLDAALLSALRSRNLSIRDDADAALSALPIAGLPHLEALLDGLDDDEPVVRRASAMALTQAALALDPDAVADVLGEAMGPPADVERRVLLATVLGRFPADASPIRERLLSSLGDPEPEVRVASATALCPFAADPATAEALRSSTIEDESLDVRVAAAAALSDPGRPKDEARVALVEAIRTGAIDEGPRAELVDAFEAGRPGSTARLIDILKNENSLVRTSAARGLGVLAPKTADARPAVAALTGALDDPDPDVRVAAADALARFGPDAGVAIPELTALARGDDPRTAAHSAAALRLVDPPPTR